MRKKPTTYNLQPTTAFFLGLLLVVSCWSLVSVTHAQQTDYKLLAPIPLSGVDKGDTQTTKAGPYIQGIFMLAIAVAGGLAVVMIIFGGIEYLSTEAISGKGDAKKRIENALWGLLLAISAWLILNTINPKLVNFNLTIPSQTTPSGPTGVITSPPGGTPLTGKAGEPLTQQEALKALKDGNIDIAGNPSLAGLRQGVVDELIALQKACSCKVIVNDATGGGHDTTNEPVCNHKNGYKVDVMANGQGIFLTNYIKNTYGPPFGSWKNGTPLYRSPSGAIYAFEGNHWDIARC